MVLCYVLENLLDPDEYFVLFYDRQAFGFVIVPPEQADPLQKLLDTPAR